MSCNRDGVRCQSAGGALGIGDTELIQAIGRRGGGNCRVCGGFLRADGGCTKCERSSANGPPVYAVVGLWRGVIEDVELVAGADQAEALRRKIMEDYDIDPDDPDAPEESAHNVRCVELGGVTPGRGKVEIIVDSRGGVVNGVYLASDPEAPNPGDGEEGDVVELVVDAPPPTIESVLNKAIQADERRPFVVVPGEPDYLACDTPEAAVAAAVKRRNAAVYVYDPDPHPANDARTPIAVYDEGQLMMTHGDWQEVVEGADSQARAIDRLLAIREELGPDYWEQGYTEDEVNAGCDRLTALATQFGLEGEIGVVWAHNDEYGFGGDSDLFYLEEREGKVYGYSLTMPFWAESEPEAFAADLLHIAAGQAMPDAVWSSAELHQEDYNCAERGARDGPVITSATGRGSGATSSLTPQEALERAKREGPADEPPV